MFFDEFNRRCTAELELDFQSAGWTTQTFPIFGVEDGSKLRTHLTCIWAHKSPMRHDTLSFNIDWLYNKKIEHEIASYETNNWKTSMYTDKHIFSQEKTWHSATPIVVGEVTSTGKNGVALRKQQKIIYDERGPLPLNILSTVQNNPPMKHTIIVKKKDGKIESIPPTEINKWTPCKARLTDNGLPSYGHRPWITSHSASNRIQAIKLRQRRDDVHTNNTIDIKVTIF